MRRLRRRGGMCHHPLWLADGGEPPVPAGGPGRDILRRAVLRGRPEAGRGSCLSVVPELVRRHPARRGPGRAPDRGRTGDPEPAGPGKQGTPSRPGRNVRMIPWYDDPAVKKHAETFPSFDGVTPLRVSFCPDAIRQHFDDNPVIETLTDAQLLDIGDRALADDEVWAAFHTSLVRAAAAMTGLPEDDFNDESWEED